MGPHGSLSPLFVCGIAALRGKRRCEQCDRSHKRRHPLHQTRTVGLTKDQREHLDLASISSPPSIPRPETYFEEVSSQLPNRYPMSKPRTRVCFVHSEGQHRSLKRKRSISERDFDLSEYLDNSDAVETDWARRYLTFLCCPKETCTTHRHERDAHNDAIIVAADGPCRNNGRPTLRLVPVSSSIATTGAGTKPWFSRTLTTPANEPNSLLARLLSDKF